MHFDHTPAPLTHGATRPWRSVLCYACRAEVTHGGKPFPAAHGMSFTMNNECSVEGGDGTKATMTSSDRTSPQEHSLRWIPSVQPQQSEQQASSLFSRSQQVASSPWQVDASSICVSFPLCTSYHHVPHQPHLVAASVWREHYVAEALASSPPGAWGPSCCCPTSSASSRLTLSTSQ